MVIKKDFIKNAEGYRLTLWLMFLCITSFLIWASVTDIDQRVRGSGKIVPSGKSRSIQHLEGGIVRGILVTEGQLVEQGDVLFQLSNKRAEQEMKELQFSRKALQIKKARLQAELDEKEELDITDELTEGNTNIVGSEKNLFRERRKEFDEKINGLEKRMNQKVLKLDDLQTRVSNLGKEMANAEEQLRIRRRLYNSGAISKSQFLDTDSEVKNFQTRISEVQKEIPITKSELSEIANLLNETRQRWRSDIVGDMNNANLEIKKIDERLGTYSDTIERTEVQSPVKGIVSKLYVNTIGGVIQPGQIIADVVPIEETLIVEGRITTEDRGKVWIGLPVVAKISAYDYSIYGGIKGKLIYISADSYIDNQNRQYYQVRVELEKTKFSDDKPIYPGMIVDINIIANKISVLDSILKPFKNIRDNALKDL